MIQVSNIDVWGFEHAIRGMRNPLNSWDKSDSGSGCIHNTCDKCGFKPQWCGATSRFVIGPADLDLMRRLYKASLSGDNHAHRKYLRQIMVSMDILAPLYFWKEFDTYKVGTVANSTSTMHKIAAKEFTLDDFSCEHLISSKFSEADNFRDTKPLGVLQATCDMLNECRKLYLEDDGSRKKMFWWQMIQLLPSSYNQLRTVTMNYENVFTIISQRTGHKLDEWNKFVEILWELPYVKDIQNVVA